MIRRSIACLFLGALLMPAPARAQEKMLDVNIGGGYTFSLSDVRKYLGDGYNFSVGLTFNLKPWFGVQAEYSYNGLGKKQISIPVSGQIDGASIATPFYADMNMQFGDLNLVLKPVLMARARPYFIAGVGVYYRPVTVTTPAWGYVPGYCSPWLYWCVPGGYVSIDQIVGTRSTTGMGFDAGAGLNLMVTDTASIYIEARYHFIWGPAIENPETKQSIRANGQFLPLVFGIRF